MFGRWFDGCLCCRSAWQDYEQLLLDYVHLHTAKALGCKLSSSSSWASNSFLVSEWAANALHNLWVDEKLILTQCFFERKGFWILLVLFLITVLILICPHHDETICRARPIPTSSILESAQLKMVGSLAVCLEPPETLDSFLCLCCDN